MLLDSKHNEFFFYQIRQICRASNLLRCLDLQIWQFFLFTATTMATQPIGLPVTPFAWASGNKCKQLVSVAMVKTVRIPAKYMNN